MSEIPTFQDSINRSLEIAALYAEYEREQMRRGQIPWNSYYGSPVEAYDKEFATVQQLSIGELLSARMLIKGQVYARDVMGNTDFSAAAKINGQVHQILVDFRDEDAKKFDATRNTVVFEGSALPYLQVRKARNFIKKHDTSASPGFDFISLRPLCGWAGLVSRSVPREHKNRMVRTIVNREVSLLSNGGIFRAQLPFHEDYRPWFDLLESVNGLAVRGDLFKSGRGLNRSIVEVQRNTSERIRLPAISRVIELPRPRIRIFGDVSIARVK